MATPRRGLGKGLGALIPTSPVSEVAPGEDLVGTSSSAPLDVVGYRELPIASIRTNPHQPRSIFDEDAMAELVFSISTIGLLQPIVVRPLANEEFELVAGERRLRASSLAGLTEIPAIIRHTEDANMLRDALLENLHRSNLNALEEAAAYSQMLTDFGCTQDELAKRIGRSRPQVTNTLRLLKLPAPVQSRVASGVLSAGHARALLALNDADAIESMAKKIIAEGLSVRSVEELIAIGAADGKPRKKTDRKRKQRSEAMEEAVRIMSESLADSLDTTIAIEGFSGKGSRGKIVIECADIADARRITGLISGE
jgi:ParB family transcriptional regulator, chromosome partitioning protein